MISEQVVVARTSEDRGEALGLVSKIYLAEGYTTSGTRESAFSKFIFSPYAKVFLSRKDHRLMGTISVVEDSPGLGLPMDALFKEELKGFRDTGKKIAEITQLAVDKNVENKDKNLISLELFKLVIQYGKHIGIDYFVIAINPKHDAFYKLLGFKEVGELKYYPSVNNAPALARVLDFKEFVNNKKLPSMFSKMLEEPYDPNIFE